MRNIAKLSKSVKCYSLISTQLKLNLFIFNSIAIFDDPEHEGKNRGFM